MLFWIFWVKNQHWLAAIEYSCFRPAQRAHRRTKAKLCHWSQFVCSSVVQRISSGLQTQWNSSIMNYGRKHDKHRDFFEFHGMQVYVSHQSLLNDILWNTTDGEIPDCWNHNLITIISKIWDWEFFKLWFFWVNVTSSFLKYTYYSSLPKLESH